MNEIPDRYHLVEVFIHNRKVGEYLDYACYTNNHAHGIVSHEAIFCSTCGDIWARKCYTVCPEWPAASWRVTTRPCARHGGGLLLSDTELDHSPAHLVSYGKNILANDFMVLTTGEPT